MDIERVAEEACDVEQERDRVIKEIREISPDLLMRYRVAKSQLAILPLADEDDAEEWAGLRFQCEEIIDLIERTSKAENALRAAALLKKSK